MNRFRSLRTHVVLLVLAIMTVSNLISSGFFFLFGLWGGVQWAPWVATAATLIASVCIGTSLTFLLSKRFLKPMKQLVKANKLVAQGDFSVRVEEFEGRTGELQELLHSFNLMVQELEGIEMYRSDFINNFSHEFKTPIVSVRGFAKQLKNPNLSEEQRQEYVDIIIKESEKLSGMSANVLQISKLENQTLVTDKTHYSLDEQIRKSILLLERQWEEKDLGFELELPSVTFYGNADMVAHIWNNLLQNAIKFTGVGGTIDIALWEKGDIVSVCIGDNGCGMSEETCSHIFEKFYQGNPSHSNEGNGLGLAIVKRIVELCNGTITVDSIPGKGTSFTVELPNPKES